MTLQEEIIQRLGVQAEIDAEEEIRKSIDFIKDYLKAHPFLKSAVLGISGGQDSTLVGRLAQLAVEELRQETGKDYRFIAVTLPYGQQADQADVEDALAFIQPDDHLAINIKASVDALEDQFNKEAFPLSDFNKGNIKARIRMVAQFAVAGEKSGVVLGTDHAAEAVTGFYTKFGDGAADLMPIYRLNKRQGRALLKALDSPAHLYEKVPTADLEDNRPLQADEDALGVSYEAIDDYLEGKIVDPGDKQTIERLYQTSEHKRQLPITIFDDFWKA